MRYHYFQFLLARHSRRSNLCRGDWSAASAPTYTRGHAYNDPHDSNSSAKGPCSGQYAKGPQCGSLCAQFLGWCDRKWGCHLGKLQVSIFGLHGTDWQQVHTTLIPEVFPTAQALSGKRTPASSPSSTGPATPPSEGVNMNPLMNLSPLFGSSKLPSSPAVNVGLDVMGDAFNQRTLDGFRAQLWGRMAKEAGARSVERERREATAMEGVESEAGPVDSSSESAGSSSPQSVSSGSPQQTMSSSISPQLASPPSSSTPPQPTVSSSPSLSMLNSPAGIRSLWDSTLSQPSLFQASIFGSGFATGKPAQNAFSQQNASSAQARAMLQAQWLALQQSRQQAAATPNVMSEIQAQAVQKQQQGPAIVGQRETYLAQFAQAVAAQQAQQQAQGQLGGLAKEVRPA
ncbi:hypothetical protein FRC08_010506, partial [Ceratobasidium sp. 394]